MTWVCREVHWGRKSTYTTAVMDQVNTSEGGNQITWRGRDGGATC